MYLVNTEDSSSDDRVISRKKNVFYFIRKTDTGDTMSGCCIWAGVAAGEMRSKWKRRLP